MNPDLSVSYLGLNLTSPLVIGASPLTDDLNQVIELEKAGASAVVTYSLFEESIRMNMQTSGYFSEIYSDSSAEAQSFFPGSYEMPVGPEDYLDSIRKLCQSVSIPVIGSLNGVTQGGWVHYAKLIQEAGASALELNFYFLATDPDVSSAEVEEELIAVTQSVCAGVDIPVSVKLSPFYSSLPNVVKRLHLAGASGVVLFNRFYQPDIDIKELETTPRLKLSTRTELLMRLRWLAILYDKFPISLGATGGVHQAEDVIKCLMTGATGVQMVSAILTYGPERLAYVRDELIRWMNINGYAKASDMVGIMSLSKCPDPQAFERANYMKTLQGWTI